MNKNMKSLFLFTTLLMLLIGVGCVAAADIDDTGSDSVETVDASTPDTSAVNENADSKTIVKNDAKNVKTASEYKVTDKTYSKYFDSQSKIKKTVKNDSTLLLSGDIKNKDFVFDNIKLTVKNDGTSTLYNSVITVQNNAKIVFDGLKLNNTNKEGDYAILLETRGNTIKNSEITIKNDKAIHGIQVDGNKNTIKDTTLNVTAPSADVVYDANWVGHPATSGLYISSSNNVVNNSRIIFDGSEQVGYFPSVDGVDIQSTGNGVTITGNTIDSSVVTVTGSNYVYGINMGRAKGTKVINTDINVTSKYYADAIQLFDADTTTIQADLYSEATTEAYGMYSTAMGSGFSQNINLKDSNIKVNAGKATAVLIEGSKNAVMSYSTFDVKGENATAITGQIDWMGNIPKNLTAKKLTINLEGTNSKNNDMAFYKCDGLNILDNKLVSKKGSGITILSTPNAKVTGNYIAVEKKLIGDDAVSSDRNDTVIKNNQPSIASLLDEVEELTDAQKTKISINKISDAKYRDTINVSGKLVDEKGNLIPNQAVSIKVNDEVKKVTTKNGVFEYKTVAKTVGSNKVTVSYAGTDDYLASNATKTFKVAKKESKIIIDPIATVAVNDEVKVTGKIVSTSGVALGHTHISLTYNGQSRNVLADCEGVFRTTFKANKEGTQGVSVKYAGNTNYLGSSANAEIKATSTKIVIFTIKPTTYREDIAVRGKLTNKNGKAIANAAVTLKINGKNAIVKTDKDGRYVYHTKASVAGTNTVVATYEASGNAQSSATKTFTAAKRKTSTSIGKISNVKVNKKVKITGKLVDQSKSVLKNTNVYVTIGSKQYHVLTDNNGVYTYTYTAKSAGTVKVKVDFKGNMNYVASSRSTSFKVTA